MKEMNMYTLQDNRKEVLIILKDFELQLLKKELIHLQEQTNKTKDETSLQTNAREEIGELSMYDNHPGDLGSELYERSKDVALNEHAEDLSEQITAALKAIQENRYGRCEVCGNSISFERLKAIPYTLLCMEHATEIHQQKQEQENNTPNLKKQPYAQNHRDEQDSFQEIAQFGTSETPSDFVGDHSDYNHLYDPNEQDSKESN